MSLLTGLLVVIIVYIPYQSHYPVVLDVKGLNMINLMFGLAVLGLLARKGRTPGRTPLKGAFILFIAALVIAFCVGQASDSSRLADDLTALKNGAFYMFFFFVAYHTARDERTIRILFGALLFVTLLVSIQAVRQAIAYGIGSFQHTHRASGPFAPNFIGANLAAAYFVIFVPLYFAVFTASRRAAWRLAAIPAGLLGIFGALFTFSRQAYIILAVQLLFHASRRHLALGAVLVALVASYQLWAPASVVERIEMTTQEKEQTGEAQLDQSTESRFVLWAGAAQLLAERPWGIGLNHFKREIGRYVPAYAGFDAHNAYVLVATEAGLLGIAGMLAVLLGMLRLALRVERVADSDDGRLYGNGMLLASIGAMGANVFGSRIFDGEVMGNFWILGGIVARYYTLALERRAATAPTVATAPG